MSDLSDLWVAFQPLDVAVFRDGRGFTAGVDATAVTTLPRPTTTAGAVGAAFGAQPGEKVGEGIAGPLAATLTATGARLSFRAPRDLVWDDDAQVVERLRVPRDANPARSDLPTAKLLLTGTGEPVDCWVDAGELERYLAGETAGLCEDLSEDLARDARPEPFVAERRVGLARTADRTAAPGFLYAAQFLRPSDDAAAFACKVSFPDTAPPLARTVVRTVVRLGGEGRLAQVHHFLDGPDDGQVRVPPHPRLDSGRVLVYLATPAVFPGGWDPGWERYGAVLHAVCVDGPETVAGFRASDPRGRPAGWALRWAVAAGSVYYLEFGSTAAAEEFATAYHGRCLVQADGDLRTAGFGMCLIGRW
jgi:CRISPR type III-B/RAMP module-associated protein Cmr3